MKKNELAKRIIGRVLAKDLALDDLKKASGGDFTIDDGGGGGTTTTSCSCDCSCDDCDCSN